MNKAGRICIFLLCICFVALLATGCSESGSSDSASGGFTSSGQSDTSKQSDISNLSEDEIAMIVGTYVGENGSVLTFFEDGTASYFFKSWSEVEAGDPWTYSKETLI